MYKENFPIKLNGDQSWANILKNYEYNKKTLEWQFNRKPDYITNKQVLLKDNDFNPIIQKYTDNNKENEIRKKEDINLKNTLAKNLDRQLKYEQTFHIINLENKLKDLNYIEEIKEKKQRNVPPDTNVPYNIISNISLNKHNPIHPNQRPKYKECEIKQKPILTKSYLNKDYNIINNKYKLFDEEKQKIDKDIAKITCLNKLNNTKDYDFINNRFYNEELNIIDDKIKNKSVNKESNVPFRGQLYNPINMKVYDTLTLKKKDEEKSNKLRKYKIKTQFEDYYHLKDEQNYKIQKKKNINYCDYRKYIEIDKRGYDIITFDNNYNRYQDNFEMKNNIDKWKVLKQKAGENETISKKKLYIEQLEKQELDDRLKQFKISRNEKINKLQNINEEKSFKIIPFISKIKQDKQINKSLSQPNIFFNKQIWFGNQRNICMETMQFPTKSSVKGKEKMIE